MPKILRWDQEQATQELGKRLKRCMEFRASMWEDQWAENERMLYQATGYRDYSVNQSISFDSEAELINRLDDKGPDIGVNKIFNHIRYIHAQLSANPPAVTARPLTTDVEDRRAADAADRVVRYLRQQYNMQEIVDQASLKCLTKGIGWIKTVWDPERGDVATFDETTDIVEMKGDLAVSCPSSWNIWWDPDAASFDECRYIFERVWLTEDEFIFRFPEFKDRVSTYKQQGFLAKLIGSSVGTRAEERVPCYVYYEKGAPLNGTAGRYSWCLEDGTLLRPMTKNPHWNQELPYHVFTDIDVEDQIAGKSVIEYEAPLQDIMNRIDGLTLDNIQAHSAIRLYVGPDNDIDESQLQDVPHIVVKGTSPVAPHFINPPSGMPDAIRFRQELDAGLDTTAGINESMQGNQKRETSALSLQTAISAGNTARRRLYNKYQLLCGRVYKHLLGLCQLHWELPVMISVLGNEQAFETAAIKGADLAEGYDLTAEYGTSFSLDPSSRREEIMQLLPLFKEAGISTKELLGKLRLNEVDSLVDRTQLAANRQLEIFEEMAAKFMAGTPVYIAPRELADHAGMLEFCQFYVMSADYKYLPEDLKALIDQHIHERIQVATKMATGGATPPAEAMQGPPATPEMPPAPPV